VARRIPVLAALVACLTLAPAAQAGGPTPGTPEYVQRDNQNIADAYGRQTGQQLTPAFTQAMAVEYNENQLNQLAQQLATPTRLAITPGNVFPGWNGGNPFRRGWTGRRGTRFPVAYTNRYGALIRGDVFAPLPGARDPYTGKELKPPYPGVVITTGSVQGSERMYWWLAQDLAERGYVVLTYDVQGQGTSETLPHQNDQLNALPFCNPFAPPEKGEDFGCPGVPAQQDSNFVYGTQDALSFFLSRPDEPYHGEFNPLWNWFDRSPDKRTHTPGRTTRVAIIGHSLGARAVSLVQATDDRVQTIVALDKLGLATGGAGTEFKPVVPALGIQSEYGFNVWPYWMSGGSSIAAQPQPPDKSPDPKREEKTGFDLWRKAGIDTMVVVPRASTHLEYTDIAYALPASRYGQALSSVYVQAWLDRYMKHQGEPAVKPRSRSRSKKKKAKATANAKVGDPLMAATFRYIEPVDVGKWQPIALDRAKQLSFYYCSGWAIRDPKTRQMVVNTDVGGVGGC
jgi:hypothetical protein